MLQFVAKRRLISYTVLLDWKPGRFFPALDCFATGLFRRGVIRLLVAGLDIDYKSFGSYRLVSLQSFSYGFPLTFEGQP